MTDWPRWGEMDWLRLMEGPYDGLVLPLAPTMPHIIYGGERYNRMKDSRTPLRKGEEGTRYGGAYLWGEWLDAMLQKAQLGTPAPGEGSP